MEDPEIPKVASEHLGPQPLPEISHCDCAGTLWLGTCGRVHNLNLTGLKVMVQETSSGACIDRCAALTTRSRTSYFGRRG